MLTKILQLVQHRSVRLLVSTHHLSIIKKKKITRPSHLIHSEYYFHKAAKKAKEKAEKEKAQKVKEKEKEKTNKAKEKERLEREKAEKERLAKVEQERLEKEAEDERDRLERLQSEKTNKSKDKKKRKDASKDFLADFPTLVVPQRQAAKKASENMMRTTVTSALKKDGRDLNKDDDKKEISPKESSKIKERRDSVKESTTPTKDAATIKGKVKSKATAKSAGPSIEPVETKEKDNKSKKAEKVDKDVLIAYVPQRQAAKKAAEHIKGLGKVVPTDITTIPQPEEKPIVSSTNKSIPPSSRAKSR